MEDQREHDELKRIAPTLFSMERRNPFVVPETFFDRFPHEVQAAITEKKNPGITWPAWVRRAAIALPMVAILAGAWWYLSARDQQIAVADLSTTPSIEELSWSDQQDLLASLDEEDLLSLVSPSVELSETELAAYLTHENVDLTELIIEP